MRVYAGFILSFCFLFTALSASQAQARPFRCQDNQELKLVKRTITARDNAVIVTGNCNLTIIDCEIEAGAIGIKVEDNGEVKLRHTTVHGRQAALMITGNGTVKAKHSVIAGRIRTQDNGEFKNGGGNTFRKRGPARPPREEPPREPPREQPPREEPPQHALRPAKPIKCIGSRNIRLVKRHIRTGGDGISIMGSCDVVVIDSVIEAGHNGINLNGSGTVKLRNSTLSGKHAAIVITGSGEVLAKGSTIRGRIKNTGSGGFKDQGGNSFK